VSVAKDIAERLALVSGISPVPVRYSAMPATPSGSLDECGAVLDVPGDDSPPRICAGPAPEETVRFVVDFRAPEADYEKAVANCRRAIANLDGADGATIGGVRYITIQARPSNPYQI
jgi:hypothetical protein